MVAFTESSSNQSYVEPSPYAWLRTRAPVPTTYAPACDPLYPFQEILENRTSRARGITGNCTEVVERKFSICIEIWQGKLESCVWRVSFHKYTYVHGDPIQGIDPNGEFAGLLIGIGVQMLLPGPGDFIRSGLQALVNAYVVNLEWDLDWALDMSLPDSLGSRLDDTWVYAALGQGLHDAFNIDTPFGSFNPLDLFGNGSSNDSIASFASKNSPPSGIPKTKSFGGGSRATWSEQATFMFKNATGGLSSAVVQFYRNFTKLGHLAVIRFPKSVIKQEVKITPNAPSGKKWSELSENEKGILSDKDLRAATAELKSRNGGALPNGYVSANGNRAIDINGVRHTWHHDVKKGRMQLVPQELHQQTTQGGWNHVGQASWYTLY